MLSAPLLTINLTSALYPKVALILPADFESLQLEDQDKKDLIAAFEDYNNLRCIYLDMQHQEQVSHNHSGSIIGLRGQLCEARSHIGAIINMARLRISTTDSKYLF